jgi:quercetin dioxygenase-like cupin family protein
MMARVIDSTRVAVIAAVTASTLVVAGALAQTNAAAPPSTEITATGLTPLTRTIAGEPLAYPSTPDPVISSGVVAVPPGGVTEWMIHPVPAYLYVLEGTLTVELIDGTRHRFDAGQSFLQCHTTWHRGRNEGATPLRFLAVFIGAKDAPEIVHPPSGPLVNEK